MKIIRQLPRRGDPRLNILVQKLIKDLLIDAAKKNKHPIANEVIRRLSATFRHEEAFLEIRQTLITKFKIDSPGF